MKYIVNIEEIVNGQFVVEANSKEEAFDIAVRKYKNCEFVLSPGDLTCKQMSVVEKDEDYIEWKEF